MTTKVAKCVACSRPRAYTDRLCLEHGERAAIIAEGRHVTHAEAEAIVAAPRQQNLKETTT